MTATLSHPAQTTLALRSARHNLAANAAALARRDAAPAMALELDESLEWVLARDGSLTARQPAGGWVGECSVPRAAARHLLRSLHVDGATACFIDPENAAQIRVALDRLRPEQALVAVIPQAALLPHVLACDDFSPEISAGRLWLCVGDDWPKQLRELFTRRRGLAVPGQLIRSPLADPLRINPLIAEAQLALSDAGAFHRKAIAQCAVRRGTGPICLAAAERSAPWRPDLPTLTRLLAPLGVPANALAIDRPDQRSPLAFAQAAADARAVVTANLARADLPGLVHADTPWITWVTHSRIPAPGAARDALLLADPAWIDAAAKAGWRAEQLLPASWPRANALPPPSPDAPLAVIADLPDPTPPRSVREFSSHALLWENLRQELLADPFQITDDAAGYLRRQLQRHAVARDGLDVTAFIQQLIEPAYAAGLARTLLAEGIATAIWGSGWETHADLQPHCRGPIASHDDLRRALAAARAVVHVWPQPGGHAVFACGRPVVTRGGTRRESFVRECRLALAGCLGASPSTAALDAQRLAQLITG